MQTKHYVLLILITLTYSISAFAQSDGVVSGKLRVKFQETKSFNIDNLKIKSSKSGIIQTGLDLLDALNQEYSVHKMERVFPYNKKYEERHRKHHLHLWYQINYDSKAEYTALVETYSELEEVQIAEPVLEKKVIPTEIKPAEKVAKSDTGYFDDPYLSNQWHYNNTGQTDGTPGADANIISAWNITTGDPGVVVSVHDQGVDVNHEDLTNNIWVNEAEANGIEGEDDDGNGFVDDINGFNFITYEGTVDQASHGTHVAGTMIAENNNGKGVAGIAGGSGNDDGAKVMSCQILGDGIANTAHSYIYAADNGAVISQNSWGYLNDNFYEQSVLDAIDYFIEEAGSYAGSPMNGGIVIFASGNNDSQNLHYPAAYNKTIAVNATGPTNEKANYSNYGTWTNISAPGGDYNYGSGKENGILSTLPHDTYGYMTGTSMACPHVSGIAALVVAKYGSSDFTNEQLRTRLLTGYVDIDELNPDYLGLLGNGAIDAEKTLEVNENIAPEKVTDLEVSAVAQEFIDIGWTIPADTDDDNPLYFDIYYSTENISLDNISDAEKVRIMSDEYAGTEKSYRIEDLLPLTKYYFALKAIDRWGNTSELSNVVSDTTNNGPDIDVTPKSITAMGDVATNYVGQTDFTISNLDEGVLQWEAEPRHVEQTLPYRNQIKPSLRRATYQPTVGSTGVGEYVPSQIMPFEDMDYLGSDYKRYIIGEEDTSLTNSSAVEFFVSKDGGFNLTNVKMLIKQDLSKGPFVLEIYSGEDINDAKLLLSQDYGVPSYYNLKPYDANITLDEQLYFEKGETFWIVFHAPSGNLYPLGVGKEANEDDSDNCRMSFDGGNTWLPMEESVGDPRWVWATVAQSSNAYLGEYVTLEPESGEVLYNEDTVVTVSADGSALPNGTYKNNIVVNTNDKDEPRVRVPFRFTVTGHEPQMVYDEIVEFGTVLYGTSKTIDITLQNVGLGNFQKTFQSVTLTGNEFETSYISKYSSIKPFTEKNISVTFTPSGVGTFNGSLEIIDANGKKVKVHFNGVGAEPPVANITQDTTWYNNVTIGDTLNGSFTLRNDGNYPMKYFMPAYADGSNMDNLPEYLHKFGYTSDYTINDPTGVDPDLPYVWNDISNSGKDVQENLNTPLVDYHKIPLGFEMPFYGETYDSIYISDAGVLTFDDNSNFNSTGYNYSHHPHGYISAWWHKNLKVGDDGGVYYKHVPGKLIVQYSKVGYYNGGVFYFADIQIHVFDNGDVEYYFGESNLPSYSMEKMRIVVENPDHNDMYLVNNGRNPSSYTPYNKNINLTEYSAVRIINPGRKLYSNVNNTQGIVEPSDSVIIDYSIETTDLYEGKFYENVSVVTNDPFNNPVVHTDVIDINAGGVSDLSVNTDSLRFGEVFQNGTKSMEFEISNLGSAKETISNVYLVNGNGFAYPGSTTIDLKAKTKAYIKVDFVTTVVGSFTDELVVENAVGELFRIKLTGEIVEAPVMDGDLTASFSDTLNMGDTSMHSLTLTNSGSNNLEFMINGNSWWYAHEDSSQEIASYDNMTYTYTTGYDENGPLFNWEDIVESGTEVDVFSGDLPEEPAWVPVELPFSFNFYGTDYDTVYVGENGLVNFTGDQGPTFTVGQQNIPSPEGVNNFIAPLYAFGGLATHEDERGGAYYQAFDNKFVIEWFQYLDNYGMGKPMSVQLLLFPDGRMKFQYNEVVSTVLDRNGFIGVENADGTKGLQIAGFESFVTDKMVVSVNPAKQFSLASGNSKNFDLVFDATEAMAGAYMDTLIISSNDPLNQETKIGLDLLISGENKVTAYDSLAFNSIEMGTLMAYEKLNELGVMELVSYSKEFTLKNIGDTLLNINGGTTTVGDELKLEYWYQGFWGGQWKDISLMGTSHPELYPNDNSWRFRLTVTPTGDTLANGDLVIPEIEDTLVFDVSTPEGELSIPVNATIQLPPAMETSNDTLSVLADSAYHVETKSFTIKNNGYSELDYSLDLVFKREADYSISDVITNSSTEEFELVQNDIQLSKSSQAAKIDGYDNTLEYDTQSDPTTQFGYNGDNTFASATEFIAPEGGFVLSHIMTWYVPGELLNSKIDYEIRAGSSLESSSLMQSGSFNHDIEMTDEIGSYIVTALEDSILFRPNEKFWVIYKYPLDATYPQGASTANEDVAERFHYGSGDGTWYDIVEGAPGYGWMVKALEKNHYETAWASINGQTNGSIPVGDSITVKVDYDASFATEANSYAEVIVSGNDPENQNDKVELFLRVNQGPQLESFKPFTVNENETLNVNISATDVEGDNFTLRMDEVYDLVESTFSNGVLNFVYTPDYDSQGLQTFIIIGEDEFGNISNSTMHVNVVNVNRAPEAVSCDTVTLFESGGSHTLNVADLFTDPDGDEMTLEAQANSNNVKVYGAENEYLIVPVAVGNSTVTFTATDIYGEQAINPVSFLVTNVTGIEDLKSSDVQVYPNPTSGIINIDLSEDVNEKVIIRILDAIGSVIKTKTISVGSGNSLKLNVNDIPAGIYFIEIVSGEMIKSEKIIKK